MDQEFIHCLKILCYFTTAAKLLIFISFLGISVTFPCIMEALLFGLANCDLCACLDLQILI